MMYNAKLKKMLPIVVGLLCSVEDRPQRCASTYIAGHNGTFTACWGRSAILDDQTSSHLPSCPSCYRHRILFMLDRAVPSAEAVPGISVNWSDYARPEECKTCADWNYDCTNHMLDATLPAKYPPSHKTNGEDDDRDDDGGLMAAPDDQEDDDSSDGEEGDDIIGHQCNSSIIEDWMFNEEDAGDNEDDPMGLSAEDSGMEEDLEGDNDHA